MMMMKYLVLHETFNSLDGHSAIDFSSDYFYNDGNAVYIIGFTTNPTPGEYYISKKVSSNCPPSFTSDALFTAAENQSTIGDATATDPDAGATQAYSITGTELVIDASTGAITFAANPDFETTSSYTATVTVTDGTNEVEQEITVNVTDVNESPSFTSDALFTAAENQSTIGDATATDPDAGATQAYSITGTELVIDASTGAITFAANPDFETTSSYTATVTVTDGTNEVEQEITVNVTDVNESPSFTSDALFTAAENQSTIGDATATDPDAGATQAYSITGTELVIDASTGAITFAANPDFETTSSYTATVTVTDGTNEVEQEITVNVTDVNESPSFTSDALFTAAENQSTIGDATATDPDAGATQAYSITGTELVIDASTGAITFAANPDFETTSSYTATVTVTDGTNEVEQEITVNVTDVNESPSFTSDALFTAAENQSTIGDATATDPDAGATQAYSITGTELVIDASTGAITFAANPDFETTSSYTATVTVTDGTNEVEQEITVNVTDVNESPSFTSDALFTAAENQSTIGDATATDPDAGATQAYSITGTELVIDASTGAITFAANPDFETTSSYTATVTVTDGTNEVEQEITVNVTDVNESPSFTSDALFTAAENQSTIGDATATDPDAGATQAYSITGTELVIDASTGAITFAANPDFETTSSYTATVTVTDGTNEVEQEITVNVTDVNESPSFTSDALFTAAENQSTIGDATATDPDAGATQAYSITGTELVIDASTGAITFAANPDFETTSSYTATVTVTDGTNEVEQEITVNVTDVNESPSFTSDALFTAAENQSTIGDATATDPDAGATQAYSITGTELVIDASTGAITFAANPDFETTSSYTATVTVTDGTNEVEQEITVNVTDVNESPSFTSDALFTAAENQSTIGDATATDPDAGATQAYSITGTELVIDASTGAITFAANPDFETTSSYTATVTVTDGTNEVEQEITVNVTDVNESPSFTSDALFTAAENQSTIGDATATDPDAGATQAYSITGTELVIDASTGAITFAANPDFETTSSYTATVTVTDGTNEVEQEITVNVTDVNESPSFTSDALFTAAENQSTIGDATATDPDAGATQAYSITGTELVIDASTGAITFAANPDFETTSSYTATVTVTDGTNEVEQEITVNVTDVNESPSFILSQGNQQSLLNSVLLTRMQVQLLLIITMEI